MIYQITMSFGGTHNVNAAISPEDAMAKAEAFYNAPRFVGVDRAIERAAEDDWFAARDGYLIRNPKYLARALSARVMRSVYMDAGYCLVPA